MTKEEKLNLIVGLSMIVLAIAGMAYLTHLADKAEKKYSEESLERYKQEGWEMIQTSRMFRNASADQRIQYFDAYWKTQGGVRPQH